MLAKTQVTCIMGTVVIRLELEMFTFLIIVGLIGFWGFLAHTSGTVTTLG